LNVKGLLLHWYLYIKLHDMVIYSYVIYDICMYISTLNDIICIRMPNTDIKDTPTRYKAQNSRLYIAFAYFYHRPLIWYHLKTSTDKMSTDKMSTDKMSTDKMLTDKTSKIAIIQKRRQTKRQQTKRRNNQNIKRSKTSTDKTSK
jgi:hypothetical protein